MVKRAVMRTLLALGAGATLSSSCGVLLGIEDREPFPRDASVDAVTEPASDAADSSESPVDVAVETSDDAADATDASDAAVVDASALFGAPYTLALNQLDPYGIAVDAKRVYWTNHHESAGAILGIDKTSDAGVPSAYKTAVPTPSDIAVDDQTIYFIWLGHLLQCGYWGVHRIDKTTLDWQGLSAAIPCDGLPLRLTTDDAHTYDSRLGGGKVKAVAKDGGAIINVVENVDAVSALTVNAGFLYYATQTTIYRRASGLAPADGGVDGGDDVFETSLGGVTDMVSDTEAVYWMGNDGLVLARAHTGGPIRQLATGQKTPQRMAVDDTYVYWTTKGDDAVRAARKQPPDSGSSVIEIAAPEADPFGIAADSDGVYWTNRANGTIRTARRQK